MKYWRANPLFKKLPDINGWLWQFITNSGKTGKINVSYLFASDRWKEQKTHQLWRAATSHFLKENSKNIRNSGISLLKDHCWYFSRRTFIYSFCVIPTTEHKDLRLTVKWKGQHNYRFVVSGQETVFWRHITPHFFLCLPKFLKKFLGLELLSLLSRTAG